MGYTGRMWANQQRSILSSHYDGLFPERGLQRIADVVHGIWGILPEMESHGEGYFQFHYSGDVIEVE